MKKNIKKALLYGVLSTLLLSGCSNKNDKKTVNFDKIRLEQDKENVGKFYYDDVLTTNYTTNLSLKGDDIVKIPDDYLSYVKYSLHQDKNNFTVNDLSKILTLDMYVTEEDLSWINYCSNLKNLTLKYVANSDVTKYINELPSLRNCSITCISNKQLEIDEDNFRFLKDANSLKISTNVVIDEDYLATTKVKDLSVVSGIESKINYKKLSFLDNLYIDIDNVMSYNSAIYFSTEDMNYLNEKGVSIEVGEDVLEINKKLDEINKNLNIAPLEMDYEKYKKISIYVMNKLHYGEPEKAKFYYNKGFLNASLNQDEGLCGSYSALITALCLRNNIDSFIIDSGSKGRHAWNIVKIENSYYYSDITALDYMFDNNDIEDITENDIEYYINNINSNPFLFKRSNLDDSIYDVIHYPKEFRIYEDKHAVISKEPVYKKTLKPEE